MANKNTPHIVTDARALYPRLNQAYRYDSTPTATHPRGVTVPCDAHDMGAEYTLNLELSEPEAVKLYNAMKADYIANKAPEWKDFKGPKEVFDFNDENGKYTAKTQLKAMFGKELAEKVQQYDAKNVLIKEPDFMLTTGSIVNALVMLVVYNPQNDNQSGVSLRLRQVQVLELAELQTKSAFTAIDGGFNSATDGFATGFDTQADNAPEPANVSTPAEKPKAKAKAKAEPKAEVQHVEKADNILNELADLTFDAA